MMKRFSLLLAILLMAAAFAGCAEEAPKSPFTADDEIFTYEKIDPEKTQLVISRTGNIDIDPLCAAFEAQNPDVQLLLLDITGGSQSYMPLVDWVVKGYAPDIMISAAGFFNNDLTFQYFDNLSTNPLLENYETAALQRTATQGNVYYLPGPSNVTAMLYNKTLFDQYGWQIPVTFDEFIELCNRIRTDTNGAVEPWNPNAKYSNELLTAIEAFVYEEVFGGVENRAWYNDFIDGQADFSAHMRPYFEVLQRLIDNDILREEHFTYSATTRGKEFAAGKIAMINMNIYDPDNEAFDFGYMPFPTTKGSLGYVCDSYSCFVGVPTKEHTEAQKDAIDRFLAFFSSEAGQRAYIGNTLKVSNVKNVPLSAAEDLTALQPAIDQGHMFAPLDFASSKGLSLNIDLHHFAEQMTIGEMTLEECLAHSDGTPYSPEKEAQAAPAPIATAPEDMTILETSFYFADLYREVTGADIGLIANNVPFRGNVMRVFAGDITEGMATVLKPRSFANDATLVKLSMTGRQLLDALNVPPDYTEKPADAIYAYSGLTCEIAPWNEPGSKYLSVTRSDGTAIDPEKLYTVGAWAGTIADQYITEVLETFEGTFEEHLINKLTANGSMTAANDGRIRLVWAS